MKYQIVIINLYATLAATVYPEGDKVLKYIYISYLESIRTNIADYKTWCHFRKWMYNLMHEIETKQEFKNKNDEEME